MIGKSLSHFKITAKLGEGGMGEVYRADDTKLDRNVAIKVLPEAVASDPERLARFEREAKVLASLNHPNIAAIYQVEEADGVHFLVMELAEGEDLAERIDRGAVSIEEALPIARQIAEALETTHEKGIIHRDLKPANVMVDEDGQVKVLDFGLAKALDPTTGTGSEILSPESESATMTQDLTHPGAVVGTAAYMSPEPARGKPLDKRSDIWSFGCVLFEMLAGRKAFEGETASDTLVAVLDRLPSWAALPAETPPRVVDLLRRCLRKDPRERLRDIGDARIEIGEALGRSPEDSIVAHSPVVRDAYSRPASSRRWPWIGLIAIAAIVIGLVVAYRVCQLLPGERVVYLINTSAPLGVYDRETRSAGGTNADDLSDLLGDVPVTLVKETTSPLWRREHQVLMQRPALIMVHLSALAHQPRFSNFEELGLAIAEIENLGLENPMELGRNRLISFLGYVALGSPQTRFIVYTRGLFEDETVRGRWLSDVESRFPELTGRIVPYDVPGDAPTASFRDPATGVEVEGLVKSILGLE